MASQPLVQVFTRGRPSGRFTSFGGVTDYVERFTAAVVLRRSANLASEDPIMAMDRVYTEADPKPPNPAYHFALSWREEKIEHDAVWSAVDTSLRALDLAGHQWISAIHADTAHTHAHVLVNRVHPQTHRYWRGGGRDRRKLVRAIGAELAPKRPDSVSAGAQTLEVLSGQKSFQRWLRETVTPVVRDMLANDETWEAVQGRVASEFGLGVEYGAAGLKLVDDSPLRRRRGSRGTALTIPMSSLRLPYDFESIDRTWRASGKPRPTVDHSRGYVAAYVAYGLPTDQVQHPRVAPLYRRFLDYRRDLVADNFSEVRRQRSLISLARRITIEEIRRDWAEGIADYLATATPEQRRFFHAVTAHVLKAAQKSLTDEVREQARRQVDALEERDANPLFRHWLKYQISAGDTDAKNALFYIRTRTAPAQSLLDHSKESRIMAGTAERMNGQESAQDGARDGIRAPHANELTRKSRATVANREPEIEPDGIRRRAGARVRRASSLEAALEAFGDPEAARVLIMRYRTYLAEFVARDPTKLNANQIRLPISAVAASIAGRTTRVAASRGSPKARNRSHERSTLFDGCAMTRPRMRRARSNRRWSRTSSTAVVP